MTEAMETTQLSSSLPSSQISTEDSAATMMARRADRRRVGPVAPSKRPDHQHSFKMINETAPLTALPADYLTAGDPRDSHVPDAGHTPRPSLDHGDGGEGGARGGDVGDVDDDEVLRRAHTARTSHAARSSRASGKDSTRDTRETRDTASISESDGEDDGEDDGDDSTDDGGESLDNSLSITDLNVAFGSQSGDVGDDDNDNRQGDDVDNIVIPQSNNPLPRPPNHFMCPIQNTLLQDPVIDREGHTYERDAILRWLVLTSENFGGGGMMGMEGDPSPSGGDGEGKGGGAFLKGTSPITGNPMSVEELVEDRVVKSAIERWRKECWVRFLLGSRGYEQGDEKVQFLLDKSVKSEGEGTSGKSEKSGKGGKSVKSEGGDTSGKSDRSDKGGQKGKKHKDKKLAKKTKRRDRHGPNSSSHTSRKSATSHKSVGSHTSRKSATSHKSVGSHKSAGSHISGASQVSQASHTEGSSSSATKHREGGKRHGGSGKHKGHSKHKELKSPETPREEVPKPPPPLEGASRITPSPGKSPGGSQNQPNNPGGIQKAINKQNPPPPPPPKRRENNQHHQKSSQKGSRKGLLTSSQKTTMASNTTSSAPKNNQSITGVPPPPFSSPLSPPPRSGSGPPPQHPREAREARETQSTSTSSRPASPGPPVKSITPHPTNVFSSGNSYCSGLSNPYDLYSLPPYAAAAAPRPRHNGWSVPLGVHKVISSMPGLRATTQVHRRSAPVRVTRVDRDGHGNRQISRRELIVPPGSYVDIIETQVHGERVRGRICWEAEDEETVSTGADGKRKKTVKTRASRLLKRTSRKGRRPKEVEAEVKIVKHEGWISLQWAKDEELEGEGGGDEEEGGEGASGSGVKSSGGMGRSSILDRVTDEDAGPWTDPVPLGVYRINFGGGLPLRETPERDSPVLGKLDRGRCVEVVQTQVKGDRVRARVIVPESRRDGDGDGESNGGLKFTSGWISLLNALTGSSGASPVPLGAYVVVADPGCVITEGGRLDSKVRGTLVPGSCIEVVATRMEEGVVRGLIDGGGHVTLFVPPGSGRKPKDDSDALADGGSGRKNADGGRMFAMPVPLGTYQIIHPGLSATSGISSSSPIVMKLQVNATAEIVETRVEDGRVRGRACAVTNEDGSRVVGYERGGGGSASSGAGASEASGGGGWINLFEPNQRWAKIVCFKGGRPVGQQIKRKNSRAAC